jgi:outer membrane protein TolC
MRPTLASAFFLFAILSSSWAQTLTIDSCYEKAKRNYPLIKQYDLINKSTEYTISNAGKSYLPQLSVTGIAGYIIKGIPSLAPPTAETSEDKFQFIGIGQLNQTIWDGGATHSQKELIKTSAQVDKAEVDVALHSIRERVNQLFFGVLLMDEQLQLLTILTDNLNRNLKAVKLSNENGLAYSSDVDEVKVELLKVEQRTIETQFVREGYMNMLALMIGEPVVTSMRFEKPIVESGLIGDIHRPELALYQHQRNQVELQNSINKVGYMPKIGLLGAGILIQPGVSLGTEKINSLALAGLSLSWNTQGIYKSANNRELTKIGLERINVQQETFLFNTKLQLTQQNSDIEKSRTIVEKDQQIVALKSSIKNAYELKYKNGICTMNDLLLATNAETEARSNQALHEAQLLLSVYSYKTTSGN